MDTDCREIHCESAIELNPTLHGFDKLWHVTVARVETGVSVYDADDWSGEGIFAVSERFDEDFAQEEGEVCVAVGCEALSQAGSGCQWLGQVIVC